MSSSAGRISSLVKHAQVTQQLTAKPRTNAVKKWYSAFDSLVCVLRFIRHRDAEEVISCCNIRSIQCCGAVKPILTVVHHTPEVASIPIWKTTVWLDFSSNLVTFTKRFKIVFCFQSTETSSLFHGRSKLLDMIFSLDIAALCLVRHCAVLYI